MWKKCRAFISGFMLRKGYKEQVVPYCVTCKKYWDPVNDKLIGWRFYCNEWSFEDPHTCAIIRKNIWPRNWLYIQDYFARYQKLIIKLPQLFRFFLFPVLPLLLIVIPFVFLRPSGDWKGIDAHIFFVFAMIHIIHSLIYNTAVALATQQPELPIRTAFLSLLSFFGVAAAFAIVYLFLPKCAFHVEMNYIKALHFSVVTIIPFGYSDILPSLDYYWLVISEIIVGFFFISILFVTFVSWANQQQRLKTIEEVLEESKKLGGK